MSARVLLIEDNEQNAYLVKYVLNQAGMEVTHANSGKEGLRLARQFFHDVILLDIQLPEMDGYEIAAQLRSDPAFAQVPLVALTSFAMHGERLKAMRIGFNGYIEKPIQAMQLAEQVRAFLK